MSDVNSSKISVEKIGGTSMTAFGDVLRHIVLHDPKRIYGRIYVVSAYSGETNQLLEHKKTGERGIYALFAEGKGYQDALTQLAASLKKLNAGYADLGLPLELLRGFALLARTAGLIGQLAEELRNPVGNDIFLSVDLNNRSVAPDPYLP